MSKFIIAPAFLFSMRVRIFRNKMMSTGSSAICPCKTTISSLWVIALYILLYKKYDKTDTSTTKITKMPQLDVWKNFIILERDIFVDISFECCFNIAFA